MKASLDFIEFGVSLVYTMKPRVKVGGWRMKGMVGERIDSSQKVSLTYGTAFFITAHTETREAAKWSGDTVQR